MLCPKCGCTINKKDSFCKQCGLQTSSTDLKTAKENYCKQCGQKSSFIYKNKTIFRLLFFLVIPSIVFLFLFPHPLERISLAPPAEGYTHLEIRDEPPVLHNGLPTKTFLQELFRLSNLERYNICFVEKGSFQVRDGIVTPLDFNWSVTFQNSTELSIPYNSSNCEIIVGPDENFTFQWHHTPIHFNISNEDVARGTEITFASRAESFASINLISFLLFYIIFIIAWYELFKLFVGYTRYIGLENTHHIVRTIICFFLD